MTLPSRPGELNGQTDSNGRPEPLRARLQAAFQRYTSASLADVANALEPDGDAIRPAKLAQRIVALLDEASLVQPLIGSLDPGARRVLGLFGLMEVTSIPLAGLQLSTRALGHGVEDAIERLLSVGLLVREPSANAFSAGSGPAQGSAGTGSQDVILIHPGVQSLARPLTAEVSVDSPITSVRHPRASDTLEPLLRLAALWQRVEESPLRRTQHGCLFKRDRDRLEDDPALAGPIADVIEPLPDMVPLWLALAIEVGLVAPEPSSDRLLAAPASFWDENAVHLPQMVAQAWLRLTNWHEQGGMQREGSSDQLALPWLRPAVLLRLAALQEDEWAALQDLSGALDRDAPGWRLPLLSGSPTENDSSEDGGLEGPRRGSRARGRSQQMTDPGPLEALLSGAAYQLGLVRVAEEAGRPARRVAQLTPLGRYVLGLGPPAPSRPATDKFLFVQPNFHVIAYRQGLAPRAIGQLARYTRLDQVGAAVEATLTPQSIYRGLEGGLRFSSILDSIEGHSARPLPTGVAETLRTWAERRDRLSYYTSATLLEFASAEDLEAALSGWSDDAEGGPVRVSDRLLLVENDRSIPFQRFRIVGARDYRRPPEPCVDIEPDGVTLTVDPNLSDLFVDAELLRLADLLPPSPGISGSLPERRFRISTDSLRRAAKDGMTASQLARWFEQRSGASIPPAVQLLLHAIKPGTKTLKAVRRYVLTVSSPELLTGLLQHPVTRGFLGAPLGPLSVVVPETALEDLREALATLGLGVTFEEISK